MAHVTTMEELFVDELRDLYNAEKQLIKALPKMAKAASSEHLRAAFEEHLQQTQGQVQRLEEIFENLGEKGTGKTCAAMEGLIKEGAEIASEAEEGPVRDAGLIAAAQKVEHYEISGYGSARSHAHVLGHEDIVSLLQATEDEEKAADRKLNDLAEGGINEEAAAGESAEGETAAPRTVRSASNGSKAASKSSAQPKTRAAGGGSKSSR
jgi:ferritin-like metal-binding protein YciE